MVAGSVTGAEYLIAVFRDYVLATFPNLATEWRGDGGCE
jgi:hypothetical protein